MLEGLVSYSSFVLQSLAFALLLGIGVPALAQEPRPGPASGSSAELRSDPQLAPVEADQEEPKQAWTSHRLGEPTIEFYLPGVVEERSVDKRTLIGRIRAKTLVSILDGGWMAVSLTQPPSLALAATSDPQILRHARDSVLKDTNGKKRAWVELKAASWPGWRLDFVSSKDLGREQLGRSHIFVVHDQILTLTAVWVPEIPPETIDRFFGGMVLPPSR